MRRNLNRHRLEETREGFKWTQWQAIQQRNLRRYRRELSEQVNRTFDVVNPVIDKEIAQSFVDGAKTANDAMVDAYILQGKPVPWEYLPMAEAPKRPTYPVEVEIKPQLEIKPGIRTPKITPGGVLDQTAQETIDIVLEPAGDRAFFDINRPKIEVVLNDVRRDMNMARYAAAQRAGALYSEIIHKADIAYQTGSYTLRQAVEKATIEAAEKGLNCIEYSDGRRVNVASYVEMALRTSSRRAALTAEGAKRNQWGEYLVISPTLASTCPTCLPWQGKVLIDDVFADGKPDGKHRLLSEAIKPPSHFLGPNCRHPLSTFFEGVSQIPTESDWDKTQSNYEAEEKQRYIERTIRKWKRREAAALTPQEQMLTKSKIAEWNDRMRAHLSENPQLRRNPERERLLDAS
jgi:hypothetical protein